VLKSSLTAKQVVTAMAETLKVFTNGPTQTEFLTAHANNTLPPTLENAYQLIFAETAHGLLAQLGKLAWTSARL